MESSTVVLSGRDGSGSNRSPQWSFYANRIRSDESHCKPGCSQLDVESNAAGVKNFSIVWRTLRSDKCRRSKRGSTKCGNCEEGKKARHKSNITSFQVNDLVIQNFDSCCFTGKVEYLFCFFFGGGGECWSKLFLWGKYLLYCFAIVSAPPSPVTINERGILNLIPCENKGNRAHVVNKICFSTSERGTRLVRFIFSNKICT